MVRSVVCPGRGGGGGRDEDGAAAVPGPAREMRDHGRSPLT
jgi:hypothetical protein